MPPIIPSSRGRPTTTTNHKLQENQKQEEQSQRIVEGDRRREVRTKKEAIYLIYDGIFKSIYFQENRREIIEKMAERCEEIDEKFIEEMTWTDNYTLKLYYAIFVHLKYLGIEVNFTKYREAVAQFAGLAFKRSHAILATKIYKKINSLDREQSSAQNSTSSCN